MHIWAPHRNTKLAGLTVTTRPFPLCTRVCNTLCITLQRNITPYHAHAHERYSSMNRVPEHDCLTFFGLSFTKMFGLGGHFLNPIVQIQAKTEGSVVKAPI